MTGTEQYCTFVLGGKTFGVEVGRVQEVIRNQPLTRVPLAAPSIVGLINLRGRVVTVIDLRSRLDLPSPAADEAPLNMIVRGADGLVSLLVDRIGEVIHVDLEAFEPAPSTVHGGARNLITGAFKLRDGLILVLDLDRAIETERVQEARPES